MKSNMFECLLCCKAPQSELSVITLNSKSANERTDNISTVQPSPTKQETVAKAQDIPKPANPNSNSNSNSIANVNNSKSSLSQNSISSPHKGRHASNISNITVENIHVKESVNSLPEIDTELLLGKELKLTGELFYNKEVIIDRIGIRTDKRKKVISTESVFGFTEVKDRYGRPVNDFILLYPLFKEEETSLFSIKYLKNEETYEMAMLNRDFTIHHLIDYSYFLRSKCEERMLIGKILLAIEVDEDKRTIKVCITDEKKHDKEFHFKEGDIPIVIGRVNSTINIASSSISKSHVIIDYSEEMQMFFIQDMGSTNKTLKLLRKGDKMAIKNHMKFKLGEIKFEIQELNPK